MLQYDCRNASVDWLHTATGWTPGNPAEVFPVIETCGFFVNATSDAPLLMTGYIPKGGNETLQEVLVSRLFPLLDWNTLHTYWDGSINFKNVTNPIADYIAVSAPNGVPSVYGNSTPVAQECVLNWCTRNFNMSYYLGNLTQKPIGDPVQQTGSAPFPWWFGPEGTSNSPDYRYDASFAFDPPGQPLNFTVSNDTMFETVVITKQFLPAFMTGRSGNPVLQYRYANFDGAPYVRDLFVNPLQEIASLHDRISKIMTNVLLTSPTGANLRVGTAWGQVVFVNVRWVWMSLPFALLFFSLIFLLATIFKSADEQGDIGIWKTSALAVLLNGLRGDVQRDIGTSNEMGEARNNADNVRVKLMLSKKGRYRLSGTSGPSWMASPKDGLGGRTWI